MLLTAFFYVALSLNASVFARVNTTFNDSVSPHELTYDTTLEKRAILPVVGAPSPTLPRLEVRQLQQKTAQWNIFLLAMQKLQDTSQTKKKSYYQLAGIHGVPRVDWDGVGIELTLALFEQQLVATAKSIATQYTGTKKTTYQNAANQLRLPFWDWAAKPASGSTLPSAITVETVTVDSPSGSKSIANPLASYKFAGTSGLVYPQYKTWLNTVRYPVSNNPTSQSQQNKATQAFDNIRAMTSRVRVQSEGLHNTVHNTAGGPAVKGIRAGHMSVLSTAAFDPIFWLHHCNVDRLFAMWQAVYPNSYGGHQIAPTSTWTIPKGSTQNANSPLTPFHREDGGFWTTADVRDWKIFHYTYPEFVNSDGSPSTIKRLIKSLYGPNATDTAGSSKRNAVPSSVQSSTAPSASANLTADDSTPLTAQNGSLYQYVANVITPRYALTSSYTIYLFNNDPAAEDPTEWILDANLIGPIGVLASENMNSDVLIVNSVPLTRTLSDQVTAGILANLTEFLVVPYLKESLKWRIVGSEGDTINPERPRRLRGVGVCLDCISRG